MYDGKNLNYRPEVLIPNGERCIEIDTARVACPRCGTFSVGGTTLSGGGNQQLKKLLSCGVGTTL